MRPYNSSQENDLQIMIFSEGLITVCLLCYRSSVYETA